MSVDIVKFAFIAGEISPTLFGRSDLTRYDLAMAEAKNFFVDYRGGLSFRPGFAFVDFIKSDDKAVRIFPFSFSPDLSNNYMVLFGDSYIRFLQDGAYVLKTPLSITDITQANPAVVTSTGHGLTDGHWVKISGVGGMTEVNGKTFEVRNSTTDTFELYSVPGIEPVNSISFTAYVSGGTIFPIYEIASPYAAADLNGLVVEQFRDLLRITSRDDLPVRSLTRSGHTSWAIALEEIGPYLDTVDVTGSSASDAGTAQVVFGVSSVFKDGAESSIGGLRRLTGIVNYAATEGSVTISWPPDPNAKHYNVYRSIISSSEALSEGVELGYAGKTFGSSFVDPNIIPDFTRVPVVHLNPFAPGRITHINISAGGSGYSAFGSTITITDPDGSGFVGQVVTDASGAIVNVIVKSGGEGYTAPVVSFGGGGSGAVATAEVEPLTGTYPSLSAIFQQRQIYAASLNSPITIWGSRIKDFDNFSSSGFALDDDSFEFDLDTPAVAPVRHLLSTRGGLLAMTQTDVWLLSGGGRDAPLTPSNALADPQSYKGTSLLKPITIDNDILFYEGKGHSVRALTYNEISRVYGSEDKSILSNHLFGVGRDITSWAFQESPFRVVWAVRGDGSLLSFTYVRDEDVFAWTPCSTQGKFLDVEVLHEEEEDRIYGVTERFINGRWTKFMERMDLHQFTNVEDAWCVDAGLSLGGTSGVGELTVFSGATDTDWVITSTSNEFSGKVGYFIRAGEGIFEILEVIEDNHVRVQVFAEPTNFIPETANERTFPVDTWTLDQPVTTLSGLDHLEGEEVSILGDGNVFNRQTVSNGAVTLSAPVTRAIVGLSYRGRAKTLPLIVPNEGIESKRKRVVGIGIRLNQSRGIKIGPYESKVRPIRERENEGFGHPTKLVNGQKYQLLDTDWSEEGQTLFIQDDPLPANILSIVLDTEIGDEPN